MGFPDGNLRQSWPKIAMRGGIGNSDNIEKFKNKIKKMQFQYVSIIRTNILAKVHQEKIICDKVRGHLLIFLFHRAQSHYKVLFGKSEGKYSDTCGSDKVPEMIYFFKSICTWSLIIS